MQVRPQVLFASVGEEAVLLDLQSGRYFGLDSVGTRLWSLLVEHRRWWQIVETLSVEYDVDPDRLRGDLAAFVEQLSRKGLVDVGR